MWQFVCPSTRCNDAATNDARQESARVTGPIEQEMIERLTTAFAPDALTVSNDSAQHHGHAGDDGSGESHFSIRIVAAAFSGVSRVERQRMINRALGDIPGQRVHALAIKASAPGE